MHTMLVQNKRFVLRKAGESLPGCFVKVTQCRATFCGVGLPQRGNKSQKHRASGTVELRCASLYIYILFKKTLEELKGSRTDIFRRRCIMGLIGEQNVCDVL